MGNHCPIPPALLLSVAITPPHKLPLLTGRIASLPSPASVPVPTLATRTSSPSPVGPPPPCLTAESRRRRRLPCCAAWPRRRHQHQRVPVTDEDDRVHGYGRTGDDSLAHLDLGFRFHNLTGDVDGVLGQTYSPGYVSALDIGAKMPVMGGAHKYLSSGLFSTDCAVSKFRHAGAGASFLNM
ncbi:hypothetical protein PVAP13_8KG366802 [Panicum virgatum]|uniref:Uncharacterized protein n=1 Tax=Panicum virgatum TaxID=38727 RepID=A0A8T0PQ10_PANVG|nr:hypothetical protein PVAP13_8KG366802 [Panicum virgatum]